MVSRRPVKTFLSCEKADIVSLDTFLRSILGSVSQESSRRCLVPSKSRKCLPCLHGLLDLGKSKSSRSHRVTWECPTDFRSLYSAQELEDTFDKSHKENLNRIIFKRPATQPVSEDLKLRYVSGVHGHDTIPTLSANGTQSESNTHVGQMEMDIADDMWVQGAQEQFQKLQRINTFAIYHKTTDGKGVPHAFNVFLRQVPALPRVVVFLSIQTVAVPHLGLPDRYLISKVRSLDGFYGCVMRKGYMDRFTPEVDEIMQRIIGIERQFAGKGVEERVKEIQQCRANVTNM